MSPPGFRAGTERSRAGFLLGYSLENSKGAEMCGRFALEWGVKLSVRVYWLGESRGGAALFS